MRFSTLLYTTGQGIKNIFRNKWYSLASIATIGLCLIMIGIFYSIVVNFQYTVKEAQDGVSVTIFFDEGLSEESIAEIRSKVEKRTEVARVHYISADEAWNSFKADYFGEYEDGFLENPIPDSANLVIYLSDVSMQTTLVNYLESMEGIRQINRSELVADVLSGINRLIGYVSFGIIFILLAVSFFLISNTVTIGISVRKEEISIMKYIGATDFFVRSPFVIEGIIIGMIGSAIPLGVIYALYNNVITFLEEHFTKLSELLQFLPVEQVFATLVPISVILGVGIGFLGSFVTVRKHIRV